MWILLDLSMCLGTGILILYWRNTKFSYTFIKLSNSSIYFVHKYANEEISILLVSPLPFGDISNLIFQNLMKSYYLRTF